MPSRQRKTQQRIEPHFGPADGASGSQGAPDNPSSATPARAAAKSPKTGSKPSKVKASPAARWGERKRPPKPKKPRRKSSGSGNGPRKPGGLLGGLRFLFYWGAVASVWGGLLFAGVLGYYAYKLPQTANFEIPARPPSIQVEAVDGTVLAQRGKMRGHAVALRDLPPVVTQAVIATEDSRFYSHFGIDPIGLARAMTANVMAGRLVQGGSSITQQLAKNMFLTPDRTIERKVQEMVMAFWLERRFTKDEILEMYLNRVYLGAGAYGVEAAAQRYFEKSARELELPEAAIIAGLLKAPSRFAPTRNPKGAHDRAQVVLARMVDEGYITKDQGQHAVALPARVTQPKMASVGYAADWVADLVQSYVGEIEQDVIVETTIDANLQVMAERAVVSVMSDTGVRKGASQAGLVAIDGIGAVRALVGGVNYKQSQYNRAVTAKRQPGSAFKPFVFLAALEEGLTPETVRIDGPTKIRGWAPQNYTGQFLGPVDLTTGLSRSLNTIAARLTHEFGPSKVAQTAKRLGIRSTIHENPSIALGTAEVSLLELTGAYVPFSNGGFGTVPHVIKQVRTRDGEVLYQRQGSGPGRVVSEQALGALNHMMARTITDGTGKNARLNAWPAAGKTGTSQDFRDAWFLGYTANLTAGVWVGNDDSKPTKKATGGSVPAMIWKAFMSEAHEGLPPLPLPGNYVPQDNGQQGPVDETLPWLQDRQLQASAEQQIIQPPQSYEQPQARGLGIGFLQRLFSGG